MLAATRIVLPRRLVPALLLAHDGAAGDDIADLELLGIARNGHLTAAAGEVVAVMVEPTVVVGVEVHTGTVLRHSTLWCAGESLIWGRSVGDRTFELRRLDVLQARLLIAQLTDLGHRPPPPFTGGFETATALLDEALERRGDDPDGAVRHLVCAGVPPAWADRVLIAYDLRRSRWTLSSAAMSDGARPRLVELDVLDAGAAGYWRLRRTGPVVRHDVATLEEILATIRLALPLGPGNGGDLC